MNVVSRKLHGEEADIETVGGRGERFSTDGSSGGRGDCVEDLVERVLCQVADGRTAGGIMLSIVS